MRRTKKGMCPDSLAKHYLSKGIENEGKEDWIEAINCYQIVLSSTTQHPLYLYFGNNNLAYSLIQMNEFDQAEPYCHAAISINEQQHNAHKNLGLVYRGQHHWLGAALSFAKAYKLAPKDERSWHLLHALIAQKPELVFQSLELREAMIELEFGKLHDNAQ